MSRADRWAIAAGNFLPLAGVLFFGWSAAPAIFVIWLDALLCNVQMLIPALAIISRSGELDSPGSRQHPVAHGVGAAIGRSIAVVGFCSPSIVAGIAIHDLLEAHFPAGPLNEAFAARGMVFWFALIVALRAFRIHSVVALVRSADAAQAYKASAADQLANVMGRCVVLLALAMLSQTLGRPGLIVFLVLASCFVTYVEWHENWVHQVEARLAAWGAAVRARRRDPS